MLASDPIATQMNDALGSQAVSHNGWLSTTSRPLRPQGWKLHVSASLCSAPAILERVLPIVLAEKVPFKTAANLGCLSDLNEGFAGISQVGKFITIYPEDDDQAVHLAVELDAVTRDLEGPRIPSDRPLRPESLVHYRYGGFRDLELIDSLGQRLPAIADPSGEMVVDERGLIFSPPIWVDDPFERAGVVEVAREPESPLFGGYLILAALHQNAKGGVYLALDPSVTPPRTCVIKEGRRHVAGDLSGRDVRDRLRHQFDLLQQLSAEPSVPSVYCLFEVEGNVYVAMEYLEGETLQDLVRAKVQNGQHVSTGQLVAIVRAVAEAISRIHDHGWIVRDLTPSNIIISPDATIKLIDFELAHAVHDESAPYGWGTRGYVSPEQARRQPPSVADDIYGLGATSYFLATGNDPAFIAHDRKDHQVRQRVIQLLNPEIQPSIADFIATCIDPVAQRRPASMQALATALQGARWTTSANPSLAMDSEHRSTHYVNLARDIGERLRKTAISTADGTFWATFATTETMAQPILGAPHLPRSPSYRPYLHTGAAGIALFLMELSAATGDEHFLALAEEAGNWLLTQIPMIPDILPGLHFGSAGVAAALCRLAKPCQREEFLDAARSVAIELIPERTTMPDMTHGWAGMGLLHLLLFETTGDLVHLGYASDFGEALRIAAYPLKNGIGWLHPQGPHTGLSGSMLSGFAHGAAGIGYFLLELWRLTRDRRYLDLALGAACWLASCAEPCLSNGTGLNWPIAEQEEDDDSERWFFWCHGAAGIARFFLHAWELTGQPEFERLARGAVETTAWAGRRGGGTLCHGLPGNGMLLIEASRVLGNHAWLDAAAEFAELLELYAWQDEHGLAWPAEHPSVVTPDHMVGYSGIGSFFLRLAEPDRKRGSLDLPLA